MTDKIARARQVLKESGGIYELEDVLSMVNDGNAQSFVSKDEESWVVTRVYDFPRKRVLDIILAVGTFEGVSSLERSVEDFAREHGCAMLMASAGRDGWLRKSTNGWRVAATWFVREL